MFIVFEGGDGTGKSETGAEYLRTPSDGLLSIRKFIEDETPPMSSVAEASKNVEDILNKDRSVVMDRYIWSTIIGYSAHSARDMNEVRDEIDYFIDRIIQKSRHL